LSATWSGATADRLHRNAAFAADSALMEAGDDLCVVGVDQFFDGQRERVEVLDPAGKRLQKSLPSVPGSRIWLGAARCVIRSGLAAAIIAVMSPRS
jgi:hypothetical protein